MSGVRSGILTFRRVNAHVYHVEDLHFCAVRRQIHTQLSPEQLITHKSRRNASVPTRYTFKSSPLPFIDSNLRIVLEFWHLLILNLLTPGGPGLNITPGIYLNAYKENIPKTPWIVAIHAHKRDSKGGVCFTRAHQLVTHQNICSDEAESCIRENHRTGGFISNLPWQVQRPLSWTGSVRAAGLHFEPRAPVLCAPEPIGEPTPPESEQAPNP